MAPPGSFDVRVTTQELIFELRPAWEVLSLPLFGAADERRIALDLGPGARAFWLDNHIDVKLQPGVPVGPFQSRFDESNFWVDLVAAARVRAQLSERFTLVVSGDYGGFDIGSSSHRTWSLAGLLSYRSASTGTSRRAGARSSSSAARWTSRCRARCSGWATASRRRT